MPERRGLPVDDLLTQTHCTRCHARDAKGMMTRVSYLRKSPEGWEQSLKRMIRLHGLQISPAEAKEIVRYLGNEHGLTRSEAERSLYESERRVHWSEEHNDQDLRNACSVCHPLGRVLAQARDDEEWQLLRATHVAMFPLSRGQMGGGPPPDEVDRARFAQFNNQNQGGNAGGGAGGGTRGGRGGNAPGNTGGRGGAQGGNAAQGGGGGGNNFGGFGSNDVGDRVLNQLAQSQGLFTPEWESFVINRREVPLTGTWTVTGHEVGRGDLLGTAELKRVDRDEYEVTWKLTFRNGDRVERTGRGLLYGGYSWRGTHSDPDTAAQKGTKWREVLLLDERWESLRGRFFTGDYDEVGIDVELQRHRGVPRVLAVESPWVTVPAQGQQVTVFGEQFPETIAATDFTCGKGVTVTACERKAANQVVLTLDVAPDAECGSRLVAYGAEPGRVELQLYDAVDYVRIRPLQGLARVGGGNFPKQFERYEAVAVHRGKDGKPYTDDDIDLWMVPAKWRLVESAVREDDDDLGFIGAIDAATGVFTPAVDGPNAQRKWSGNNTGEVFVECTTELHVPERKEPPKEEKKDDKKPGDKPADGAQAPGGDAPTTTAPAGGNAAPAAPTTPAAATPAPGSSPNAPATATPQGGQPAAPTQPAQGGQPATAPTTPAVATPQPPAPTSGQPKIVARSFRARASLVVTVPLYVRWTRLEWEGR